ncbi:hypothetical protein ABZ816_13555 [Actinosynnema sp. NPDC047251]|uniref:Secreted protein n=1 Tax=Saccharothrix espanaensis (strain ATCC 51144 / DSM 44229 / JCM 9112 / NBRC 15066 / NRRL 15764) TaxID=1179773 RepID=K0KDK1_SACES|nr:hypothetical protein [Saccharothrix espanaensis]CCH35622.1 hypothetical protein BN6_84070 [Saccharothrix espanaensis DSM 44229]
MADEVSERREWRVRCTTDRGAAARCSIEASRGVVEVFGPDDRFAFALDPDLVADFRASLDAALARAEADLPLG